MIFLSLRVDGYLASGIRRPAPINPFTPYRQAAVLQDIAAHRH